MGIDDLLAGKSGFSKKTKQAPTTYEKISFSAYPEDVEWFKDFKWHLTVTKGMTRHKDAFAEMVKVLRKKYSDVTPRPEHIRTIEKEQGRPKGS